MAQCDICGRTFARNEHLIRHHRTHTGERPFRCPHCKIGFHRADVRAKHIKKIHPENASPSESSESLPQAPVERPKPKERERSRLACDQCRKRKLKCNNVRPCEACRSKMLQCTVSSSSRPPGRPRNPVFITPSRESIREKGVDSSEIPPVPQPWVPSSLDSPLAQAGLIPGIPVMGAPDTRDSNGTYPNTTDLTPLGMEQWMTPETTGNFSIQAPFPNGPIPMDPICDDMDLMDNILPQLDLGNWLDDLNEFSATDDTWPPDSIAFNIDSDPSMDSAVEMMKDHFQRRSRATSPSREEQRRSWYSAPPQLYVYDKDVMNILLNVAKTHISSTFSIFSDFEANYDTRVELCLAMAAVGGLYSTAYASIKVAKMLFNDSRRLLLEQYLLSEVPTDFGTALSVAKTFVLIEIYMLCSGDKRAYEFIEVFHASKLHAIGSCISALPHDASLDHRRQAGLLLEAVRILDCYRVLLLQRPPSFIGEAQLGIHGACEVLGFQALSTGGLISTSGGDSLLGVQATDMDSLATIICYSWMASPQNTENSSRLPLWRSEFVELALDRWIQAKTEKDSSSRLEVPQMLLYHLTQVSLHSNLNRLQRLTQVAMQTPKPFQEGSGLDSIRAWRDSHHFNVAQWHAKTTLRIAQEAMTGPRRHTSSEKDRPRLYEAPHLPLCIYFATLVIWWGELVSGRPGTDSGHISAIETGSQLLFRLKVPVAKLLGTALCELLPSET
ncbi:hypothetical protein F5Y11DRAFT_327507 [Daldinia sp. FL1419]|nr:hypothetical protein F5Y11DRAFT_327507 [Daldinia sp. FL1419]